MAKALLDRIGTKLLVGDGCWEWTGVRTSDGYGQIYGRMQMAHRVMYELLVGPIPEGLELDHLCRNPWCVRPDHLEPVTTRENVLRGVGISAVNARKTECLKGHSLSGENLYLHRGKRRCRTCRRAAGRRYDGRRRG